MPDIRDAVKITSTVESASASATQQGVPAIVGESGATDKDTPKKFTSLELIKTEHGESSDIYIGASVMFTQGVKTVYTVAIDADTAGTPTATEVETTLATLLTYASAGEIDAAVLAGITDAALLAKLKSFADAARVIFVATHAADETVSNIIAAAAGLESVNGFYVAFKSVVSDDVACAVLGAIMVWKPYYTLTWMSVDVDVDDYFSPTDIATLEGGRVNAVIQYSGENRLSNGLSLKSTVPFLDTTRTQYYIEGLVASAVADNRMKASQVPYTQRGFEVVRGWIVTPLESLKRANAIQSYSVSMPKIGDISDDDKAARKITGVAITVQTISDIQEFDMSLNIKV
ncbi:MAG: hypothetical protein JXQ82_07715 [Methanomicrobiaceae archaeon]|nr:hypothetical protein [Methanomicrobiaceae archaeon]